MIYNPVSPHSLIIGSSKSKKHFDNNDYPKFYYLLAAGLFWHGMPFETEKGCPYSPYNWQQFVKDTGIGFAELALEKHYGSTNYEDQDLDTICEKLYEFYESINQQEHLKRIGINGLFTAGRFFMKHYEQKEIESEELESNNATKYYHEIFGKKPKEKYGWVISKEESSLNFDIFVLPSNSPKVMHKYDPKPWCQFWQACKKDVDDWKKQQ